MTQFASLSVSDQAKIDGRDDHTIRFRPGEPGMIRVRSVPAIVRAHAEFRVPRHTGIDNPASGMRRNLEEKRNRYLNKLEIAASVRARSARRRSCTLPMPTGARARSRPSERC